MSEHLTPFVSVVVLANHLVHFERCLAASREEATLNARQFFPYDLVAGTYSCSNASERWLIHSAGEDGYWSNKHGWTAQTTRATEFSTAEKQSKALPMSADNDARWITLLEALWGADAPARCGLVL